MTDDLADRPITAEDLEALQALASVPLRCYSCDAEITAADGGWWIVMRPGEAYPHCKDCVGNDLV